MIRFVRVNHDDEKSSDNWFSFYCTVMDDFVWFNDNQIFKSISHFKYSYQNKKNYEENRPIERFLSLIPEDIR